MGNYLFQLPEVARLTIPHRDQKRGRIERRSLVHDVAIEIGARQSWASGEIRGHAEEGEDNHDQARNFSAAVTPS